MRRARIGRWLAYGLVALALGVGTATYVALSGAAPFGPEPGTILLLINVNLILLLTLAAVVAWRLVGLWLERRRGLAGSRLHIRLVVLFSLVAVIPTTIVAVFSALFFNLGVEAWFSDRVRTAVVESHRVAQAYLEEHRQVIRADILAMANDLNSAGSAVLDSQARLSQVVQTQALLRSLPQVIIFDGSGGVLTRFGLTYMLEFDPIPSSVMQQARNGEVVVFHSEDDDRVRAIVRLERFMDAYLYVGRFVDQTVLDYIERTLDAVQAYERLEGERSGLQITFALIFAIVALLLLLAAIWVGLTLATQLARPISGLIDATERVRAGDLGVRIDERAAGEEVGSLARAFNRMTSQLETNRRDLVEANRQLDGRRRFTEAVLSGVSAGVLGVDLKGRIDLPNRSAVELLATPAGQLIGRPLNEVVPEMTELLEQAARRPQRLVQGQLDLVRGGRARTLLVRIAAEQGDSEAQGYVVTFDDITELLSAQRKAAWADVARRIAHEIKNPLTPIQLSAERLKRRYLKEITSDPETFQICTDTIVRQVGDIGRMVDEFSAFARMPTPVLVEDDAVALARQAVFLQRSAYPQITFTLRSDAPVMLLHCDGRLIGQALTNLLKNAAEAIAGSENHQKIPSPEIVLSIQDRGGHTVIEVSDNGPGFPAENRNRLAEPYVTTRLKGTGLGLAIVKKIIEEHGGELVLGDHGNGGASVAMVFPLAERRGDSAPPAVAAGT